MPENKDGLETERKYIVDMPDNKAFDVINKIGKKYKIIQTYLVKGKNDGSVRRVRKTEKDGKTEYFYTEKTDVSFGVRREIEREISKEEYDGFLKEKDENLHEINKERYVFGYENNVFELDVYPFEKKYAILETELENIDDKVEIPTFLKVVKDVTGENAYTNYALSMRKTFFEEK